MRISKLVTALLLGSLAFSTSACVRDNPDLKIKEKVTIERILSFEGSEATMTFALVQTKDLRAKSSDPVGRSWVAISSVHGFKEGQEVKFLQKCYSGNHCKTTFDKITVYPYPASFVQCVAREIHLPLDVQQNCYDGM